MISLIAALSKNQVIGIKNNLPWYLPADLAWFKKNTIKKPVIMGRLTFESIGKPLYDRLNIVISTKKLLHSKKYKNNLIFVQNLNEAFKIQKNVEETIVIGGESIYKQTLKYANKLYLTHINEYFEGDKKFPNYLLYNWITIFKKSYNKDIYNNYDYCFEILKRIL